MGVFFTVPLYLQLVLGLDALETSIKMLPVSITMFLASAIGSWLSSRYSVRTIVRSGLATIFVAILALLTTVEPQLAEPGFAVSMALFGIGMGLLASQLGNAGAVVEWNACGRGEAGGRARREHHRGRRGRLRLGPAPGPQGGSAGGDARPDLVGLHPVPPGTVASEASPSPRRHRCRGSLHVVTGRLAGSRVAGSTSTTR